MWKNIYFLSLSQEKLLWLLFILSYYKMKTTEKSNRVFKHILTMLEKISQHSSEEGNHKSQSNLSIKSE